MREGDGMFGLLSCYNSCRSRELTQPKWKKARSKLKREWKLRLSCIETKSRKKDWDLSSGEKEKMHFTVHTWLSMNPVHVPLNLYTLFLFSVSLSLSPPNLLAFHFSGRGKIWLFVVEPMRFPPWSHKTSTKLILYWFQSTYILFILDLISLNMLTFSTISIFSFHCISLAFGTMWFMLCCPGCFSIFIIPPLSAV